MIALGELIKRKREQKGLSQEALANLARINIRTLQRIEKGETSPYGATLKSISDVLEMEINQVSLSEEERKLSALFELSALTFLVFPFGNLITPYVMRLLLGERLPDGQNAWQRLKMFQLIWTVALFVFIGFLVYFMIRNSADMTIAFAVIVFGLVSLNTILPIRRAYLSYKGRTIQSLLN